MAACPTRGAGIISKYESTALTTSQTDAGMRGLEGFVFKAAFGLGNGASSAAAVGYHAAPQLQAPSEALSTRWELGSHWVSTKET